MLDGTGAPATHSDVCISEGVIQEVSPASDYHGDREVLDASELTLAPGFIDAHSHADNAPFLADDDTTKILQGVTTEVVGNCGMSLAPRNDRYAGLLAAYAGRLFPTVRWSGDSFSDFLSEADRRGYVTNYAPLVGHGTLRIAAMGMEDRPPTAEEQKQMGGLLEEALEAGAFGLSTGLIYPPGLFSKTEEIIELARGLPPHALYASHIRGEGENLLESIREAIRIGEEAGVRTQISHHKAAGRENWGKTKDTLKMIAQARGRGVEVYQDVYPYTASSTMLTALLPPYMQEGGDEAVLRRLREHDAAARIRQAIEEGVEGWENHVSGAGWDGILISSTADHRYEGMTIEEISGQLGLEPVEVLVRILLEEQLRASMVVFSMDEADLQRVLREEHTMIGSDGLPPGFGGKPHPRLFGTFPRVLARYVREAPVFSLEEAVRRMTSLPARVFRIPGRGVIEPGKVADLVAFDAREVRDVGDYRDPVHTPEGIRWVLQAGQVVVDGQRYIGNRKGQRLQPATSWV